MITFFAACAMALVYIAALRPTIQDEQHMKTE